MGSIFGGADSQDFLPPPPPPSVVEAAAPEPVVEEIDADKEDPVVDVEASRARTAARRKAAEDRRLFSLNGGEDETVILTKSLLGD